MSQAAVPAYLGRDFSQAPPGHRFGLYLEAWNADWTLDKKNKTQAIKRVLSLPEDSKKALKALRDRQLALAQALNAEIFDALATAPFATGLGVEHPLENGFAFLDPHGLPYLPGSGVKGVLRAAARELASGEWGGKENWDDETILALFGFEPGEEPLKRGALSFWDVIPQLPVNKVEMRVDVMTPHQSHYYQKDQRTKKFETPHDSGQPNPIPFLTVPSGALFRFVVSCDERYLPEQLKGDGWKNLLRAAFVHAYEWLGFGAKTAVGYGAMQIDPEAAAASERKKAADEEERLRLAAEDAYEQQLAQMSPVDRVIREYLDGRADKNQPVIAALTTGIEQNQIVGVEKQQLAQRLQAMMKEAKCWKEKSAAKNPNKDTDHQRTLKVLSWLAGK
ncbi:MAG: type III-B CRISPR module RAMP protein Cmr6 [Burkholderiales bacterium]